MKMYMMKLMVIFASSIFMLSTPMSMGILLMLQTFLSTIMFSSMLNSSWITMIMFMMLIGGLLILFMYMSSIASNEKFKPNIKMLMMMLIIMYPLEELMFDIQLNDNQNNNLINEMLSLSKIYNKKTWIITMLMFYYLLLTMIAITKIIKIYKGPLRSK
uniref:NADH dehydrogenase subunit 6 n=1 Tax=Roxasellana stellata TaxID=2754847 RepID=A0A7G3XWD5_9HEMI|nr:NADH dehydrogenase subunit 6 [Roxasellana stellata]QLJ57889.1 NADH dehydrogenase subunit 6 [Roxasellana stellata]